MTVKAYAFDVQESSFGFLTRTLYAPAGAVAGMARVHLMVVGTGELGRANPDVTVSPVASIVVRPLMILTWAPGRNPVPEMLTAIEDVPLSGLVAEFGVTVPMVSADAAVAQATSASTTHAVMNAVRFSLMVNHPLPGTMAAGSATRRWSVRTVVPA